MAAVGVVAGMGASGSHADARLVVVAAGQADGAGTEGVEAGGAMAGSGGEANEGTLGVTGQERKAPPARTDPEPGDHRVVPRTKTAVRHEPPASLWTTGEGRGVMGCPPGRSMPLFLLRDGAIRCYAVVPDGLALTTYTDRHQRQIHVLLDANSERLLLRAQPPVHPRKLGGKRRGAGQEERPLAA
ncbi:MAG: hypothetical protein ACK6BC_14605 [Cyanobacteriota bacterium]